MIPGPVPWALAALLLVASPAEAQDALVTELAALNLRGRGAEARREAEAGLAEREPRNRADWTLKDSREARALLTSVGAAR
ncbi:MAG TPA: hypothetical protein VJU81_26320 [Methylomirabilota bacterium]|nr:hypothetical protein [Methylomirabilota bacterium]